MKNTHHTPQTGDILLPPRPATSGDEIPKGIFHAKGDDSIPPGTFHGDDVVVPGTFHDEDKVPPGTFHGDDTIPPGTFHHPA